MRLGEVCESISQTFRRQLDRVVLINTSDVLDGKVINHAYVPNENLRGQFKKSFFKNDILYSEIRPKNRHFAFVDFDARNYVASTKLMVIRANEQVLPEFLFQVLKSDSVIDQLQLLAETRSGTFPQVTFSELAALDVSIPSIDKQREIASTLRALDDKIANNTKVNHHLEQMAQAIFKSWFVDFEPWDGERPDDWKDGCLGDIIELFDFKRVPLSGNQREKMEKIYPYYGAAALMDYVDDYLFDGTYLLLGEDGTVIDELGFPTLQYVWGKFWVNNHAHILQGRNGFTAESLYTLLKQASVTSIVTGAVQPKINQANLKSLGVVIPSGETIEQFNALIDPLFTRFRENKDENLRLAKLRDALLPRLMSGELSVADLGAAK